MRGYWNRVRNFSRNAHLYMLHVIGMDAIYGSWEVIFNLYLLQAGFGLPFVGLRLLLNGLAEAAVSVPAGAVSNRIGRKLSFILGDGVGASMAVLSILTLNGPIILGAAVVAGLFSALHQNAEPAFMAENSRDDERTYLFSSASSLRTASATIGALVAGWVSLTFAARVGPLNAYREATVFGIGLWFLSLVPALLLRPQVRTEPVEQRGRPSPRRWIAVTHPDRVWKLGVYSGILALGGGLVVPLFNVYFHLGLQLNPGQIGLVFALGGILLAFATLLAPTLEERFGAVKSVTVLRLTGIPVVFLMGLLPGVGSGAGALGLVFLLYAVRHVLLNMGRPITSSFGMNILDPEERTIGTGMQTMMSNVAWAGASFAGALILNRDGYVQLFALSAGGYLAAQLLYYHFFSALDRERRRQAAALPTLDPAELAQAGSTP